MHILRQSTAVDVLIGPFVDNSDGYTAESGESPTVKVSKNGQGLSAKNNATTPVHSADGYYNCELDATDTNTVGTLVLSVAASANALPVRHEFQIVEEAIYDALFAGSATGFDASGRVDIGKISGDATAADNLEAACDGTGYNLGNGAVVAASVSGAVGSVTGAVGSISGVTFPTNFGDLAITATSGRVDVGSWAGSTVAAPSVSGVPKVDVAYVDGTAATGSGAVDANIVSISGDTVAADNLEAACDGTGYNVGGGSIVAASVTGAVGSVTGAVGSISGVTFPANFNNLAITATTGRVDVGLWAGSAVATPSVAGVPEVDVTHIGGVVASGGGTVDANVVSISGDTVAADNLEAACDGTGYNVGGGSIVAASVTGAVGSVTGNLGGNVAGTVGSVVGNVGGNVTGSVGSVVGNVGGNVTGSVGSISGVTFPTNFGDLAITASDGRVDVGLWAGSVVATPSVAGVPEVDVTYVNGVAATGSGTVDANVVSISGDTVAADNLELAFDGTGYGFTNCTLPWNSSWDAEVQSECAAALTAYDVATEAELAKVPKSDGTATWNSTATGTITSRVLAALTSYDVMTVGDFPVGLASDATLSLVSGSVDATKALLDKIATTTIGNCSGAGSGTEIFEYDGVTLTSSVTVQGNRTNVIS